MRKRDELDVIRDFTNELKVTVAKACVDKLNTNGLRAHQCVDDPRTVQVESNIHGYPVVLEFTVRELRGKGM